MIEGDDLFEDPDPQFEESIRIDRDLEIEDPAERREELYSRYLDDYHLTGSTETFLEELFSHLHAERPDSDERNHWLYGYYGSGKSHLLTALDLLLDTQQLTAVDEEQVWNRFDSEFAYSELGKKWQSMHDDVVIVPLSINLLRYQGVREQSFSEIVLQEVYKERGFADRLDVAFFEEEFQRGGGLFDTQEVWDNREELVNEILSAEGVQDPAYDWSAVRQYQILSDIVLEELTERATGMVDNLEDIQNRKIGQELAVQKIESYRQELETQFDRPVKIALLMDEVTLFIGGNYERLSELNALSESIKDVGQGNIISVVTAQSNIEDVQPGLAVKKLNFGILKDRFPQQYELPSRHVGEIVQQRLLAKSAAGQEWIKTDALTATVDPSIMLTYREVTQNTAPPLDSIDDEQFIEYYPLLPYQPALFMEILSNLRNQLSDATKSIFSGTARAVLSIVAGLRSEWMKKEGEKPIISLVDFYNLVQYELEDIIPEKTDVIDDIEKDSETTAFDLKIAKAVLLLSYVPEMIPQTDSNLATAVMDDLEGEIRSNVQTRVRNSLEGNLEKYIRPDTSTDGADLRLTDREEQRLISNAREHEGDPDWDDIIDTLDHRLWDTIIADLELPVTHDWETGDTDSAYPVGYSFEIDGQTLETGHNRADDVVFDVDVMVRGLRPDVDADHISPEKLYWLVDSEGIEELRSQLIEWWALNKATRGTNPPESVVRDRSDAANRIKEKLQSALSNGEFRVQATELSTFQSGLSKYVGETYPDYFHPELARVTDDHLDELQQLDDEADLPSWADTIGVPRQSTSDFATFSDIAFQVRKLIGTEIQNSEAGIDVATILDRVVEEEPLFGAETDSGLDPSPALLAVLWGLCRAGVFRLTTVDNDPISLDTLLAPHEHPNLTLATIPMGERAKDVFVDHDIIEPTASENQGYINFADWLETVENRANALANNASVQAETTFETETVGTLISNVASEASEIESATADRRQQATTNDVGDLRDMIEATESAETVLEMAETQWEERLPFLLQLEGLVRLESSEIGWFDTDLHEQLQTLVEQIEAAGEIEWWKDDEWPTFVSEIDARQEVIQALEETWENHQAKTSVESFHADLVDHPWLVDPRELPTTVYDGFRIQYLDPLRNFRTTVDRVTTVFDALTDPEPGSRDKGTLTSVLGRLNGQIDWESLSSEQVGDRREQFSTVESLVSGDAPGDLTGIGILHADEEALRAAIEGLDTDDWEPDIIETDSGGVIVQ